jgi:hypothetical protein
MIIPGEGEKASIAQDRTGPRSPTPAISPGGMTGVLYGRLAQATGQVPSLATR